MANRDISTLIGNRLKSGLPHPGRPDLNEGPRSLDLVAFRTAGMPPELAQHVDDTAQAIGEAVVHLIETEAATVLISRAELDQLRAEDQGPGVPLSVICAACRNPVVHLAVTNGRALIAPALLAGINTTCPHTTDMEATP